MLGLAFPAVQPVSEPFGWAVTLWGAFLYWWAGIIYAIETARVVRVSRVSPHPHPIRWSKEVTVADSDMNQAGANDEEREPRRRPPHTW